MWTLRPVGWWGLHTGGGQKCKGWFSRQNEQSTKVRDRSSETCGSKVKAWRQDKGARWMAFGGRVMGSVLHLFTYLTFLLEYSWFAMLITAIHATWLSHTHVLNMDILFCILFHCDLSQDIWYSSLGSMVETCVLKGSAASAQRRHSFTESKATGKEAGWGKTVLVNARQTCMWL